LIKRMFKQILGRLFKRSSVVRLTPKGPAKGRVLLSYLTEPFLRKHDAAMMSSHTNFWECAEMARIYQEHAWAVDVIHYQDISFIPKDRYDILIDIRLNLARLAPLLNADCRKFFHLTGTYWEIRNAAARARLEALQQRKGVKLNSPRVYLEPIKGLELAEGATMMGNDHTIGTYRQTGLRIHRIYSSPLINEHFICRRDPEAARNGFLFLSSSGLVLKGLDLVLDAFTQAPQLRLDICGDLRSEEEFYRLYQRELEELPQITQHGWTDLSSGRFRSIAENAVAIVYPSSAEGSATAVINAMHAGLIPIVSLQSGVDVGDFGFVLKDCSIEEIRDTALMVSQLPANELKARSEAAVALARQQYTRKNFTKSYTEFVEQLK